MADLTTEAIDGQLWYPRNEGERDRITVDLYDVRAADPLVIGYDYDRDGWTIARATAPDEEVAFIRSWADLEESPEVALRASLSSALDTWDGDALVTTQHALSLLDHLVSALTNPNPQPESET